MAKANKWGEVLGSLSSSLEGNPKRKRSRKSEPDPFDIFTPEFKSVFAEKAEKKDKETNEVKDGYKTGVDSYLAFKRSHKKRSPTTYNNNYKEIEKQFTKFSSPKEEQQTSVPTNTGEYNDFELQEGISYDDPVISTKVTPTSKKLGVPRPGPSTFIQTARYNPSSRRLNIQYTDGTIFPYHDVSPELADEILKKKTYHSPGQTLLNTIFYGHGTTRADQIFDIDEGM